MSRCAVPPTVENEACPEKPWRQHNDRDDQAETCEEDAPEQQLEDVPGDHPKMSWTAMAQTATAITIQASSVTFMDAALPV